MGILNPVAGKMYDRIGGRPLALLGFAIMTFAAVLLVTIMNTHTTAACEPESGSGGIGHWSAGFVPHSRHRVRGLFGRIPLHSRPWTSPRPAALSDSFIDRRLS